MTKKIPVSASPPQKSPQKKTVRRQSRTEWHERLTTTLFLLPSIIGVLIFFILPFMVVIYQSTIDNPISQEFVGFQNYINIVKNTAFQDALRNTMTFSLTAVPLVVVLSLLLALALDTNLPFRTQFRTVFITPLMVPVASIVLIWQVVFHQNGAANELLARFGVDAIDWLKSDYSQLVIVLLYLWKNLGYNMILFMAALSGVPVDITEVAMLEGANAFQRFWHIKLRYLSSSIVFVTLLSLINSFKIFREVYLLTGSYPYDKLYLLQHFMNNTFGSLDYQKLSTAAIILCAGMVVIIGVMFIVDGKIGRDLED